MPDEVLTDPIAVAELDREYHPIISKRMARRMREQRAVPIWVVGRRAFVSRRDVENYIAARRRPARAA